ncbi:MAG: class B sortase [Eubacteriales bacterium]|nr:class B sortase [Eubacteriales bacterium]
MAKLTLKILNKLVSTLVGLILLVLATYSIYALWDNKQVYSAAEDVQADMLKLKPIIDPEDNSASFEELLAINEDVCAWISLDNTKIDYPVLQGEDILSYINTDVYGNFALPGSIFLDTTNDKNFQDAYSLIYGHHMTNHQMFGDLDLYEERSFFDNNTTGTLILPDRSYQLEIFACMLVKSSEEAIFRPEQWLTDINGLLAFAQENSLQLHPETIEQLQKEEHPQILGLSTCSTDFTDARTVVLARMVPSSQMK